MPTRMRKPLVSPASRADFRDGVRYCSIPSLITEQLAVLDTFAETIRGAVGRRLLRVFGPVHVFGERLYGATPGAFWFEFEDYPAFGIKGCGHGEGLELDSVKPVPMDMGESGEIIVRDLARGNNLKLVEHQVLSGAWEIRSANDVQTALTLGIRLEFGPGPAPAILNLADELELHFSRPFMAPADLKLLEVPL